jgi:hypothetical protein
MVKNASMRSSRVSRTLGGVRRECFHVLDHRQRLWRRGVNAGPYCVASMLADRVDGEVPAIGGDALGACAHSHSAAGLDVVGIAEQLHELDPGSDLIGRRVIG